MIFHLLEVVLTKMTLGLVVGGTTGSAYLALLLHRDEVKASRQAIAYVAIVFGTCAVTMCLAVWNIVSAFIPD